MKRETIAIHSGYETDPTTKAVAVPIYQTVAYAFDSTEHAAALFNLEAQGFRYTRISNPTTAVLERRVAALEGGMDALCVSSGQAAVTYAVQNVAELGSNIISTPQLYGTTHTLFAHLLPSQGIAVRFAESDRPESIEKLIDENTRAVFCESVGNPAGNVCDIEALAQVAHRHGVPLIVDNTVATPILLRPIARRSHHRQRQFPLERARVALSCLQPAGRVLPWLGLHRSFWQGRLSWALP
jgi:O-acetylhomoserine (thiol)-lyase